MDFSKCLKRVTNSNEYMSFTRDVEIKFNSIKIQFNMSTVLSLKKIRAFEIEYFNKYEENGAATRIFELMLRFPPMKTWSLLGKELVCLLQYWLEALRKHLILHNVHWWPFLKLLLKFIKDIRMKDSSMNNVVIEETADCLLDLATSSVPDVMQRYEIVRTFNICGAESSRKIRLTLRNRLQNYFIKLSTIMATTGDFRIQYSMLETLLRWLLPRHQLAMRQEAADKWFPPDLYSRNAVAIFLERTWQNFTKDARDFLNAHNENADLVVSTACNTLTVGRNVHSSGRNKKECWVDVNSSTRCITIMLDAGLCEGLGGAGQTCDVLIITDENTRTVRLDKDSAQVVIIVNVLEIMQVYPFSNAIQSEVCNDIHIQVETSCLLRLNIALRNIFGDKYQSLFDMSKIKSTNSPEIRDCVDIINNSEEDTRFSNSIAIRRRKHSGFIVRPSNPRCWNSPSTVSTSSLAQLHEKLVALPRYTYDKEPVSVCALPQLSSVTEVSETEENQALNGSASITRLKTFGVCQKRNKNPNNIQTYNETTKFAERKVLSPSVNDDEHSVSCLLLATIGSADNSVIIDTIERLPKDVPCNTDNIVDLLAQEALQLTDKVKKGDTNINTSDHKERQNIIATNNSTHICNITQTHDQCREIQNTINNIANVDESSNEVVDNTQTSYLNVKKTIRSTTNRIKQLNSKNNESGYTKLTYHEQAVEDFFSQHLNENRTGDLFISPTLAKKINETSSDNSEDFDSMLPNEDILQNIDHDLCLFSDIDVVECLNAMVDKVCQEFDICAGYLDQVQEKGHQSLTISSKIDYAEDRNSRSDDGSTNLDKCKIDVKVNTTNKQDQCSKAITLKYTNKSKLSLKTKPNINTNQNKKKSNTVQIVRMSPIVEVESANEKSVTKIEESLNVSNKSEDLKTPLTNRKRKLYSPKDEPIINDPGLHVPETEGDETSRDSQLKPHSRVSNSVATSYKDIEKERKKQIRKPRARKLKTNKADTVPTLSPRTKKMNEIFDGLKEVVSTEKVTLVDKDCPNSDIAIYNYTSESDDDGSKNARLTIGKQKKSNTEQSAVKDTTHQRKQCNKKNSDKTIVKTTKRIARRKQPKLKSENKQVEVQTQKGLQFSELKPNLEDERMRANTEKLDTSDFIECPVENKVCTNKEHLPALKETPQMEYIAENNKPDEKTENQKQIQPKTRKLSLKKQQTVPKRASVDCDQNENERSMSPLPGLLVETVLVTQEDVNDSVTSNIFQKFKDIYHNKQAPTNSELNTTQNILSDSEPLNGSVQLNVTEELQCNKKQIQLEFNNSKPVSNINEEEQIVKKNKQPNIKPRKNASRKLNKTLELTRESEIVLSISSDGNAGRTIPTWCNSRSPITGHGDFQEAPPNPALLDEDIQPRNMEMEYLSESLKGFFCKLTSELNLSPEKQISVNPESPNKPSSIGNSSCVSNNSPVIAVKRLSSEDISRWLPSRRNSISSSEKAEDKSVKTNTTNKSVHVVREIDKAASKVQSEEQESATDRTTMISPIRLDDDLAATAKTKHESSQSEEGCVKRVRKILSTKNLSTKPNISNHTKKVVESSTPIKENQKSVTASSPLSKEALFLKEYFWTEGTILKDSGYAAKRKSSPLLPSPKKPKLILNNNAVSSTITHSTTSAGSVNDWLGNHQPTLSDHNLVLSIKDSMKSVLEKLDTTLVEIQHNTSKSFINMFVDAQKELNKLKDERRNMYKETASEIITDIVKIVDAKFSDLDQRSQILDDKFMESLKERSHDLIRQDCKQKQLMVTLLKEDTQAVIEYMINKEKE